VDWYEAFAEVMGESSKVYCFAMRSMAGGGAFHRAYYHATQQAFLEAHEFAFPFFGEVFGRLRYDNLKSAVKKILRGHQREESERFIAFRSHWGFETESCNPVRGNEKGGVEGEVGYFRRNHLVPVPRVESLEELNELLLDACHADEQRRIAGKSQTVGEAMRIEREHLLPLPAEKFDLPEISFPVVDSKGCVKVRTNCYSTPLKPGARTQVKLLPAYVEENSSVSFPAVLDRNETDYTLIFLAPPNVIIAEKGQADHIAIGARARPHGFDPNLALMRSHGTILRNYGNSSTCHGIPVFP
jgi:hypothetical protein